MNLSVLKISFLALPIFFIIFCKSQVIDINSEKKLKVSLRTIGHEHLLSLGDSVSRVLPLVKREGSSSYSI